MELISVTIDKPDEVNLILGQSHFIKTVEDLHEAGGGRPRRQVRARLPRRRGRRWSAGAAPTTR